MSGEPKENAKVRQAKLRKERKDNELCVRCGEPNDRLPKIYCSVCAVKAAFEYERYREKRNVSVIKHIRLLEKRVEALEKRLDGIQRSTTRTNTTTRQPTILSVATGDGRHS